MFGIASNESVHISSEKFNLAAARLCVAAMLPGAHAVPSVNFENECGRIFHFPGWCDRACTSASLDCMPHPFVLPLAGVCVATVAHVAVMLAVLGQAVGWLHYIFDTRC